jgi:hypothetical protein
MWHEHYIRGGDYPYAGGWVSQPLDLLVKFQAMTLVYGYKMSMKRMESKGVSNDTKREIMGDITDLQHELVAWVESE